MLKLYQNDKSTSILDAKNNFNLILFFFKIISKDLSINKANISAPAYINEFYVKSPVQHGIFYYV